MPESRRPTREIPDLAWSILAVVGLILAVAVAAGELRRARSDAAEAKRLESEVSRVRALGPR